MCDHEHGNSSPCASVSTHGKWGVWTLSLLSQLWLRWCIITDGFLKGKVPPKHIAFRLYFIVFSYKVTVFSDTNNTNDNIPLITPSYPQYPNQGLGLDWMVPKGRLCSPLHLKPREQCLVHKSSSVFMSLSVKKKSMRKENKYSCSQALPWAFPGDASDKEPSCQCT